MEKFTFKTEKPTGKYKSFSPDNNIIKLGGLQCGTIEGGDGFRIRLMVEKQDINEDGHPNCSWKWVSLKKQFLSLTEAKQFILDNSEKIQTVFKIHRFEE